MVPTNEEDELIERALREDFGPAGDLSGDLTTRATIPADVPGTAAIIAREALVVCGHDIAARVFAKLDPALRYSVSIQDGQPAEAGAVMSRISGSYAAILSGERVALNFLQRMSGIASQTRKLVSRLGSHRVSILDTRKTTPGLRTLEKYAVRIGGGVNHRMGLYDQVLIKNNHVDFLGGDIAEAILRCRKTAPPGTLIQVEVRNQDELRRALTAAPDAVLLDNMTPEEVERCVTLLVDVKRRTGLRVEASGGIGEQNLSEFAATGVDCISVGALTHSVRAADISLRFVPV